MPSLQLQAINVTQHGAGNRLRLETRILANAKLLELAALGPFGDVPEATDYN